MPQNEFLRTLAVQLPHLCTYKRWSAHYAEPSLFAVEVFVRREMCNFRDVPIVMYPKLGESAFAQSV